MSGKRRAWCKRRFATGGKEVPAAIEGVSHKRPCPYSSAASGRTFEKEKSRRNSTRRRE